MFAKTWARALSAFGHPADSEAVAVTEALLSKVESMRVDCADLDLDSPSDAFEALRRIAATAPVMHGEAPQFRRVA
jgi:UrcA family protein